MMLVVPGVATFTDSGVTVCTRPVVGLMTYAACVGGTVTATAVSPGACDETNSSEIRVQSNNMMYVWAG